ncbi:MULTISPECIES: histidine phosphatase family protein [Vibrio]|uniref:histidine phosphatase family protein n=1 Tax=Vibrio TaxID=662 RepID=UPI0020760E82|nr:MULTISPECIES: histidine phosphatase family protein [Vibrio]USD33837.1 histidine phosphatase family protein [Vibrio sp. SCSIO 43186]USD46937.1 histidine phosphatase family protein [Vibrio sp. SCSIO 43145]USD70961.1 histidine phosphatase family protein [Vibrio sp. SCSIO 43139]USD95868.1 alpha-ribazole phosphatase [Vibrio coralliilyticus]
MKTVNIYLLRHGKTQGEPALNGSTDALVDSDTQQAICRGLISSSLNITHVVTSPLRRCQDLAALLVSNRPALSLSADPQLQEMNFGELDGQPFDCIKPHWPLLEQFWQDPAETVLPEAETLQQFHRRVTQRWTALVESVEEDTLIICHGGTIRMILASILDLDWKNPALYSVLQIDNQSLTHIQLTRADSLYQRVCSIGVPLQIKE